MQVNVISVVGVVQECPPRPTARRLAFLFAATAWLAGCGGEADTGSVRVDATQSTPAPSTTSQSPTPSPTADHLEYQRSSAATALNADATYRAGMTGRGIRIAVIDTGLSPGLAEFAGRVDPASADMDGGLGIADQHGHGTWVSSVILAARDGVGMHGVAFDATLLSFNVSRAATCSQHACPLSSALMARAIDATVAAGARVINLSSSTDAVDEAVLAAVRRAVAANAVIVISAGNEAAAQPLLLSRAIADAGGGTVIIAGACDAAGRPYAYNNAAGSGAAAASYLTAIGVDVTVTGRSGEVATYSGTSFSAPAISGAVALVAQARPNWSGAQIVSLILGSAVDAGAHGRDPIYGNGVLDLTQTFAALSSRP